MGFMGTKDTIGVLFLERVSVFKGALKSDSIEAQDLTLFERLRREQADGRPLKHAGTAVDKGVSGYKIDIFDRRGLGEWLEPDKMGLWDEVWITKLDRSVRRARWFLMFNWMLKDNGKKLVILNDPGFSFETAEDEVMAHMKAVSPQKEVEAITERVTDSHARRHRTAAWQSAATPYGYESVFRMIDTPNGPKKRKTLVLHKHTYDRLHDIRNWIVHDDLSLTDVMNKLNDMGELTAADWVRVREGRKPGERLHQEEGVEPQPAEWSLSTVVRMLKSRRLLGVKMTGTGKGVNKLGTPTLNDDGTEYRPFPAVFTDEEFDELQSVLKEKEGTPHSSEHTRDRIRGTAFCARCGYAMNRQISTKPNHQYVYIRCRKRKGKPACPGVGMPSDNVERFLSAEFLNEEGEHRDRRRIWDSGEDHSTRIKELETAIGNLTERLALVPVGPALDSVTASMKRHSDELEALKAKGSRKAGWIYIEEGKTFGEMWPDMDWEERRRLLIKRGVKFFISEDDWWLEVPTYWPGEEPDDEEEVVGEVQQRVA
ncbi:predicted protein [Streptomyces sp. C]|nr:predicted protein [Streptomyces sp. C]